MEETVEQGATVVTEGGGGVGVDLELVPAPLALELEQDDVR